MTSRSKNGSLLGIIVVFVGARLNVRDLLKGTKIVVSQNENLTELKKNIRM
jgi:hypothetical protein